MHFLKDRGFKHPYSSEITPKAVHGQRREMLRLMASGVAGAALASWAGREALAQTAPAPGKLAKLPAVKSAVDGSVTMEKLTPYSDVTGYNNYYEFGTDKEDPAANAKSLKPSPWKVSIEGEIKKPKTYDLAELMGLAPIEERIYRMRCVEGWSMVIPWEGYSLSELIKKLEPTGNAKYVEFTTLADKAQMPGLRSAVLDWPYVESLRMDEAMNPLTLLTFGLYGEVLPNQNGAPVRIEVPWKYGFKSAKSLVKIRFTDKPTDTSWMKSAPREYGYFSNVNPNVDHPRWSQATERRIGEGGVFAKKRPTLMFNGYEQQVASMYAGMDLKKFYEMAVTAAATAPRKRSVLLHPAAKPVVFVLCLLPLAWLTYGAFTDHLGANPAEAIIHSLGDWTLRFLCITLAVTPVRTVLSQPALLRFRRMLGLFTFFYVVLHFLSYSWLDKGFDIAEIAKDIAKRPYILVGTAALLLMIPLAATSFNRAIKAMGAKRWQALHRLIYVIALLGILHFYWERSTKHNLAEVSVYALILAVLLGWRLVRWAKSRRT